MKNRQITIPALLCLSLFFADSALSQSTLSSSVLGTAASNASASGKVLHATLGQTFVGVSGASGKNTGAGYWYLITQSQVSTDIETINTEPGSFSLNDNYPNPFNPETSFSFTLPKQGQAKLAVFDMLGNEVQIIVDGDLPAGEFRTTWKADGLSSGTYFYRLESQGLVITKKMTLMK